MPSAAIIDSQSVKTTEKGGPEATTPARKVKGRKRHIVVDTLGTTVGGSSASRPIYRIGTARGWYYGVWWAGFLDCN